VIVAIDRIIFGVELRYIWGLFRCGRFARVGYDQNG